jgi:drug/metabolite transporter (DMT)-like permease
MSGVSGHLGELAAVGTALCWTCSSVLFTAAGKRVGSLNVNLIRLGLALVLAAAFNWLARGRAWPTDATVAMWWWLSLSGVVGFVLGDLCLMEGFVVVGTRLTTLLLSLAPPLTALLGWWFLGERLGGWDWLGMGITLAGIALVLAEKHGASATPHDARSLWLGVLLGVGSAVGQAVGLVLSKRGINGYDAFAATQIRLIAGTVGFLLLFAIGGRWRSLGAALREWPALWRLGVGAFFGPFVGVGLALVAVQRIPTGIAATLTALVPVFVIPVTLVLHGERIGWRALVGTMVAVAGVAVLCLK